MFHQRKKGKRGKGVLEIRPKGYLLDKLDELNKATGKIPLYMDLVHVNDDASPYTCDVLWNLISDFGPSAKFDMIPTTGFYGKGLQYQELVGSVAGKFGNGVCVRLSTKDLFRVSIQSDLQKLLQVLRSGPGEVDIMIDLKLINESSTPYDQLLQRLPDADSWRTITFLAGSFPKDLSHLRANNTYRIARLEWIKWFTEEIQEINGRRYGFGDYTVQHPMFSEPPEFPNPSASIRYTAEDYWIVLRGEALRKPGGIGHAQYPAEAQLLVDKPEYSGEGFSYGDRLIMEKTKDESRPGNPEQWIMIGINHHITYTVCQLNPEMRPAVEEVVIV